MSNNNWVKIFSLRSLNELMTFISRESNINRKSADKIINYIYKCNNCNFKKIKEIKKNKLS